MDVVSNSRQSFMFIISLLVSLFTYGFYSIPGTSFQVPQYVLIFPRTKPTIRKVLPLGYRDPSILKTHRVSSLQEIRDHRGTPNPIVVLYIRSYTPRTSPTRLVKKKGEGGFTWKKTGDKVWEFSRVIMWGGRVRS